MIEREASARCSVDSMMKHVLDATAWPAWQPEIIATVGNKRVAEGDIVSGKARMLGFGVEGRSYATKVGEDVFEEDVVVGVAMRVRYEVRPDGANCRVTHRLESNMPTGLSGRLLAAFLRGRLKKMQKTALERLVAQSESDP
jgi:Polyketide cyclase / dehydrase and lipid transport